MTGDRLKQSHEDDFIRQMLLARQQSDATMQVALLTMMMAAPALPPPTQPGPEREPWPPKTALDSGLDVTEGARTQRARFGPGT